MVFSDRSKPAKPAREFIAIHDAWGYLNDQYNVEQIATYEPVEGKQPTAADIKNLQTTIASHNITTFFTEPQKQSTGATRFLKDDLGLTIAVLDPLGGSPPYDSYINLMRTNINAIINQWPVVSDDNVLMSRKIITIITSIVTILIIIIVALILVFFNSKQTVREDWIKATLEPVDCPPVKEIKYPAAYYQGPLIDTHFHFGSLPTWPPGEEESPYYGWLGWKISFWASL